MDSNEVYIGTVKGSLEPSLKGAINIGSKSSTKSAYVRAVVSDIYCALIESNPNGGSHVYVRESVDRAEELWDELSKRGYTS